jgi:undecaprenyl phosphate-alpha-L-ara4N flippase subunit ArnE
MQKLTLALLSISAVSAAVGQLLLKSGADGKHTLADFINAPLILGLLFYAVGVTIWIYVLSQEALVNVYAFTALTFVLVYLGGVIILREQISVPAMVGVALILAGLYLIVRFNSQG